MRPSRFSDEQISSILSERTPAVTVAALCRKHGISRTTFYRWRRQRAHGTRIGAAGRRQTRAFSTQRFESRVARIETAASTPSAQSAPPELADFIGPVRPVPVEPADPIRSAPLGALSWPGIGSKAIRSIGDFLGFQRAEDVPERQPDDAGWGWFSYLTVGAALSLVAVALGYAGGRGGWPWATDLYWITLAGLFFPVAARIAWPSVSRRERVSLVVMLGVTLYLVKVLQSPSAFIQFDELLHVPTAVSIFEKHHLFSLNSLLPISPLYAGMEIVTTAIAHLTGLSIFWSGVLLLGAARSHRRAVALSAFRKNHRLVLGRLARLPHLYGQQRVPHLSRDVRVRVPGLRLSRSRAALRGRRRIFRAVPHAAVGAHTAASLRAGRNASRHGRIRGGTTSAPANRLPRLRRP